MVEFLKKMHKDQKKNFLAFIVIALVLIAAIAYAEIRIVDLSKKGAALSLRVETLESNFASTSIAFQSILENTRLALENQQGDVASIAKKLKSYQREVGSITGTVETLEKLSKTDPELLQKYSKVFFLNEHYAPPRLAEIPSDYEYRTGRTSKIHADVWPHLEDLLAAAKKDSVNLFIYSAYRSFDEQQALKGQYTVTYGAGTANTFSADQGYSEHQLGTTVDFIVSGLGGVLDERFEKTPAFAWLQNNAYKYGFVLSYPKGNNYYVYEPWHWRYVGEKLADDLHDMKKNFYDLDQREIDTYLADIFE